MLQKRFLVFLGFFLLPSLAEAQSAVPEMAFVGCSPKEQIFFEELEAQAKQLDPQILGKPFFKRINVVCNRLRAKAEYDGTIWVLIGDVESYLHERAHAFLGIACKNSVQEGLAEFVTAQYMHILGYTGGITIQSDTGQTAFGASRIQTAVAAAGTLEAAEFFSGSYPLPYQAYLWATASMLKLAVANGSGSASNWASSDLPKRAHAALRDDVANEFQLLDRLETIGDLVRGLPAKVDGQEPLVWLRGQAVHRDPVPGQYAQVVTHGPVGGFWLTARNPTSYSVMSFSHETDVKDPSIRFWFQRMRWRGTPKGILRIYDWSGREVHNSVDSYGPIPSLPLGAYTLTWEQEGLVVHRNQFVSWKGGGLVVLKTVQGRVSEFSASVGGGSLLHNGEGFVAVEPTCWLSWPCEVGVNRERFTVATPFHHYQMERLNHRRGVFHLPKVVVIQGQSQSIRLQNLTPEITGSTWELSPMQPWIRVGKNGSMPDAPVSALIGDQNDDIQIGADRMAFPPWEGWHDGVVGFNPTASADSQWLVVKGLAVNPPRTREPPRTFKVVTP